MWPKANPLITYRYLRCDQEKSHPKFNLICDRELTLISFNRLGEPSSEVQPYRYMNSSYSKLTNTYAVVKKTVILCPALYVIES